ncbi:hypothetical protein JHK84_042977 [Glycine max]|nr:hypothetical protein JHK84_042977 [Glycine max]
MQNLFLPQGVCDAIDRISRQFIWGSPSSHWVDWNTISLPRSNGGLGIRPTREASVALHGKHVWSVIHDPTKLWVQIQKDKYLKGDWIFHHRDYAGCFYTWTSIKKLAMILQPGFSYRIGQGFVSMWYDVVQPRGLLLLYLIMSTFQILI